MCDWRGRRWLRFSRIQELMLKKERGQGKEAGKRYFTALGLY